MLLVLFTLINTFYSLLQLSATKVATPSSYNNHLFLQYMSKWGVYIRWNGMMEWNSGMDYWNGGMLHRTHLIIQHVLYSEQ